MITQARRALSVAGTQYQDNYLSSPQITAITTQQPIEQQTNRLRPCFLDLQMIYKTNVH